MFCDTWGKEMRNKQSRKKMFALTLNVVTKNLQDTVSLFVDEAIDTLDTTAVNETTNSRFGSKQQLRENIKTYHCMLSRRIFGAPRLGVSS